MEGHLLPPSGMMALSYQSPQVQAPRNWKTEVTLRRNGSVRPLECGVGLRVSENPPITVCDLCVVSGVAHVLCTGGMCEVFGVHVCGVYDV